MSLHAHCATAAIKHSSFDNFILCTCQDRTEHARVSSREQPSTQHADMAVQWDTNSEFYGIGVFNCALPSLPIGTCAKRGMGGGGGGREVGEGYGHIPLAAQEIT